MKRFAVLLCLSLTFPSQAQTIFRCVAKNGKVSLQSEECPIQQKQTWKYYERPAYNPESAARLRRITQEVEQSRAHAAPAFPRQYAETYSSVTDRRGEQRVQCANAKRYRDATLRAVGMARTFDLLRQLDDHVYSACKGM